MKRTYVKNGDILEIPLDKYMPGYGYAKYLDSTKVWGIDYPGVLRIYNFINKERGVEMPKINRELLMAPLRLFKEYRKKVLSSFEAFENKIL